MIRRLFLANLFATPLLLVSGCLGDDNMEGQSPETPESESQNSSTVASNSTSSATESRIKTNSCDDQPITSDIELANERSTQQRVSVTVCELPAGTLDSSSGSATTQALTQSPPPQPDAGTLFEAEYVVDTGETYREEEHVYRGADPDNYDYRFDCTLDGETSSLSIQPVVRNPTLYGVHIALREDGPELWMVHGDPGPRYNPNCY